MFAIANFIQAFKILLIEKSIRLHEESRLSLLNWLFITSPL